MPLPGPRVCGSLVLALLSVVVTIGEAHVSLLDGTSGNLTMDDVPAGFGPGIPADGVSGRLVVADPEDACSELVNETPKQPWIALIVRSRREPGEATDNCTFDRKVRRAERAGAIAAIVYDDAPGWLFAMEMPAQHYPGPNIPSVFITQVNGLKLKAQNIPDKSLVMLDPYSDAVWMSLLLTACAGMLAIAVVIAIFYFISDRRQRGNAAAGGTGFSLVRGEDGMSEAELRALPVVIHETPARRRRGEAQDASEKGFETGPGSWSSEEDSPKGRKAGGTLTTCAICIEEYKEGDKLRVLPCKHRFHMECIDQWLAARKPLCPICKWNALDAYPARTAPGDVEAGLDMLPAPEPRNAFFFRSGLRWPWRRPPADEEEEEGEGDDEEVLDAGSGGARAVEGVDPSLTEGLLSATPVNFPGMHAVRRMSERSLQSGGSRGNLAAEESTPDLPAGLQPATATRRSALERDQQSASV